jgi:hypothetical protein
MFSFAVIKCNNISSYPHVSIMIKITNQQLFSTIYINNTMIINEIVYITLILEIFNYSASEHVFKDKCSRKYAITAGPGNVYIPW